MSRVRYRVLVLELDDVVPRRSPTQPNLLLDVFKADSDPVTAVGGTAKLAWAAGRIVRMREDLSPKSKFMTHAGARKRCVEMSRHLAARGFTVNRETTIYCVYVIALDPQGVGDVGKGYVYVGQTAKSVEERFREHKAGPQKGRQRRHSSVVYRRGIQLVPRLAPKSIYFTREDAEAAEARTAKRLKARGYRVEGGH